MYSCNGNKAKYQTLICKRKVINTEEEKDTVIETIVEIIFISGITFNLLLGIVYFLEIDWYYSKIVAILNIFIYISYITKDRFIQYFQQ